MVMLRDLMSATVTSTAPDTPVAAAAEAMLAGGFRHLPVIEGHRVVGPVSLPDLLSTHIGRG